MRTESRDAVQAAQTAAPDRFGCRDRREDTVSQAVSPECGSE